MESMTVGRLAEAAAVNQETVRFYEREGLMPKPERSASGYRLYQDDDVDRLLFIQRAKQLGFTLKETKELLTLCEDDVASCHELCERARAKAQEIEERIVDLARMRDALHTMVGDCSRGKKIVRRCSVAAFLNAEKTL